MQKGGQWVESYAVKKITDFEQLLAHFHFACAVWDNRDRCTLCEIKPLWSFLFLEKNKEGNVKE